MHVRLTPYVEPELFQSSSAEAIDTKNEGSGAAKRSAQNRTVGAGVVAERKAVEAYGKSNNEADFSAVVGDETTGLDSHEPHADTESAEETA